MTQNFGLLRTDHTSDHVNLGRGEEVDVEIIKSVGFNYLLSMTAKIAA